MDPVLVKILSSHWPIQPNQSHWLNLLACRFAALGSIHGRPSPPQCGSLSQHMDSPERPWNWRINTFSPPLSLEDTAEGGGGWDGEGSRSLEAAHHGAHHQNHQRGVGSRRRVASGRQSSCSTARRRRRQASHSRSRRAAEGGGSPWAGRDWI